MISTPQMRWLAGQPLPMKLAAVELVWQGRADNMILIADQLWAAGKNQEALGLVVMFASRAASAYERVGKSSDFARVASDRVHGIASSAILKTAVVSQVASGVSDGLDTEALIQVCECLGITPQVEGRRVPTSM